MKEGGGWRDKDLSRGSIGWTWRPRMKPKDPAGMADEVAEQTRDLPQGPIVRRDPVIKLGQ